MPRRSTIKTSLEGTCDNDILVQVLRDTVKKCRKLTHVGYLFVQYLLLSRLQNGEPLPPVDQDFVYAAFCQLIGRGSTAPEWVRHLYTNFEPLILLNLRDHFWRNTSMITVLAKEYATNFWTYVPSIFKRKTLDYFLVRFSDDSDDWSLQACTTADRRKVADYVYNKVASDAEAIWPQIDNDGVTSTMIDGFLEGIYLGPAPITDASIYSSPHQYLPWLYQVLQRFEQQISITEPTQQNYASKAYVHRKLKEVIGLWNCDLWRNSWYWPESTDFPRCFCPSIYI